MEIGPCVVHVVFISFTRISTQYVTKQYFLSALGHLWEIIASPHEEGHGPPLANATTRLLHLSNHYWFVRPLEPNERPPRHLRPGGTGGLRSCQPDREEGGDATVRTNDR